MLEFGSRPVSLRRASLFARPLENNSRDHHPRSASRELRGWIVSRYHQRWGWPVFNNDNPSQGSAFASIKLRQRLGLVVYEPGHPHHLHIYLIASPLQALVPRCGRSGAENYSMLRSNDLLDAVFTGGLQ